MEITVFCVTENVVEFICIQKGHSRPRSKNKIADSFQKNLIKEINVNLW